MDKTYTFELLIQEISKKILEEINKGILDLYEECKMGSLESQPLDTAYKNLAKFFDRIRGVKDGLNFLIIQTKYNFNSSNPEDFFMMDYLIGRVLVEGKDHPQNLHIGSLNASLTFPCSFYDFSIKHSKEMVENWEEAWIDLLNNIKSKALKTLEIKPLINEINRVKKLLINEVKKDDIEDIFKKKKMKKETNTDLDNDAFFNNLK